MNIKKQKALGISLICEILLYCIYAVILSACASFSKVLLGIISCIGYATVFTVPIFAYKKLTDVTVKSILTPNENTNDRTRNTPNTFLMLVFAFAITVTAVNLFSLLTNSIYSVFGASAPINSSLSATEYIFLFIRNVIFAALFEELLFRGVVFDATSKLPTIKRILISALLFALMHCSLRSFLYAFAAGAALAYFTLRSNSVIFGIAVHFMQNLCTFVFSLLSQMLNSAVFKTVSDISFLILITLAVIGIISALFFELKHRLIAPATAKTNSFKRDFPLEIILYIVATALITVMNF